MVSTHLKNISQNGNLPQTGVKIKNIWNHHPVNTESSHLIQLQQKGGIVMETLGFLHWKWTQNGRGGTPVVWLGRLGDYTHFKKTGGISGISKINQSTLEKSPSESWSKAGENCWLHVVAMIFTCQQKMVEKGVQYYTMWILDRWRNATPVSLGWSWPLTKFDTFWEWRCAIYFHHSVYFAA